MLIQLGKDKEVNKKMRECEENNINFILLCEIKINCLLRKQIFE